VLSLIVFAVSWLTLSLVAAAGFSPLQRRVAGLAPWHRSFSLLAYALYPPALATAITLALFMPGVNGIAVIPHCHGLDCAGHVPVIDDAARDAARLVTVALALPIVGIGAFGIGAVWRSTRLSAMVALLAQRASDRDYQVLESGEILAACVGMWRPVVVVSRGLIDASDARELEVVTLHERAHAVRYDNARHAIAQLATLLWPASRRRECLAALRLSAEQSCDFIVAESVHDRGRVADTIDALSRRRRANGPGLCGDAAVRVATLRACPQPEGPAPGRLFSMALLATGALTLGTLLAAGVIHHGAERMLGG